MNRRHWTNCGTGITNFSAKSLPIYEETLKRMPKYNGILEILKEPMTTYEYAVGDYSLHQTKENIYPDLSDFWMMFNKLKMEMENQQKPS